MACHESLCTALRFARFTNGPAEAVQVPQTRLCHTPTGCAISLTWRNALAPGADKQGVSVAAAKARPHKQAKAMT